MDSSKTRVTYKQWRLYHANLLHTLTTAKRWIALGIVLLINIAALYIAGNNSSTSTKFWENYQMVLGIEIFIISIMECGFVYSDDFKAKTMQSAIGRGIKRRHVVLCKLIELITVLFIDYVLVLLSVIIVNFSTSVTLNVDQILEITLTLICKLIGEVAMITIAMIPAFYLQSSGASVLIYIAVRAGVGGYIALLIEMITHINLQNYLVSDLVNRFRSYLLLGTFSPLLLLGILIWIVVSYMITTLLFSRKELDF